MRPWLTSLLLLVLGCELQAQGFSSWDFFDQSQRIRTAEDVEEVRAELIDFVFGEPLPTRMPDRVRPDTDDAFPGHWIQELKVDKEGLSSIVYLIHPDSWNGALALYHQGPGGDIRAIGQSTIVTLLEAGYHVLAFSMPMIGMNTHPFETDEHYELSAREHPLGYFAEPVVVALNWAEATYEYSRRIMLGLSGGGWTTVLVAGIDERIDASYPISGSWPHYLRDAVGHFGDYEDRITPNYLELYLMATYPSREQVQFFGEFDECCFGGLYSYDYLAYTSFRSNAWSGRFTILLDHDEIHHEISDYVLREVLDIERVYR